MKTAICGLVAFAALTGCTASHSSDTPLPRVQNSPDTAPTPTVTFGCTGCSAPTPVSVHACLPPLCRIETPRPASRSRRSTPVKNAGDKIARTLDVTSYCTGATTWSGKPPADGMVAVADYSIPMYSKAHVWGEIKGAGPRAMFGAYYDRTFTVTDHIGSGSDVDIYMTSCSRGRTWGRQHLHVTFTTH